MENLEFLVQPVILTRENQVQPSSKERIPRNINYNRILGDLIFIGVFGLAVLSFCLYHKNKNHSSLDNRKPYNA